MLTTDEIHTWASNKFPAFVEAHFAGTTFFPLEILRFGRAKSSDTTASLDHQIRQLLAGAVEIISERLPSMQRSRLPNAHGYSVELTQRRMHAHGGEQAVPCRVWFATQDDFLAFIKKSEVWEMFLADACAVSQAGNPFGEWVRVYPRTLLARLKPGDGHALALALSALHGNPQPNCFAREIALPGVSGKFIEENLQLLADILQATQSKAWQPAPDPHQQLGLRRTSRLLRLMPLDGSRNDYGVPLERFTRLPEGITRLLIIENLRTFLTLPTLSGALGVYGEGHAAQTLSGIQWLREVPLHYWGDIDPSGFVILNNLRREYPEIRSVLMDEETLLYGQNTGLLAPASPVVKSEVAFELLTPTERAAGNFTQTKACGIEQEKIPAIYACERLQQMGTLKNRSSW